MPLMMSLPGQRSRIQARSSQSRVGSNWLAIHWARVVRLSAPLMWPSRLPKERLGARSTFHAQRGLLAMSSRLRSVTFGGTDRPFLISRWRCPCTVRSAVSISAEHSAARARTMSSRVKPRSRITYTWNQKGAGEAARTCSIEQMDIVLRQNGIPAFAAARAPWISPLPCCKPVSPVGAIANGMLIGWPTTVVESDRLSTLLITRWRKRRRSNARRFSRSVDSS